MVKLVWDKVGDKTFESGLDRGVLYLPDGTAVPWNGLTSIVEKFESESSSVYYDGMKISELVNPGSFTASMKAVTYPDEFLELEGLGSNKRGVYYADQSPQFFHLCYRTLIGDDVSGPEAGYKLHILYNVVAVPADKTYASVGEDPSLVEFEWDISAIPEEIPGFRPTSHIIIDSRLVDDLLLPELEKILYGDISVDPELIPMTDLVAFINSFLRVSIIDNGDGTWTAIDDNGDYVQPGPDGYFEINGVDAWYLNDETYVVKSTTGSGNVPVIKIWDNGDGTFTIHSEFDELVVLGVGLATINNANAISNGPDTYQLSDTIE